MKTCRSAAVGYARLAWPVMPLQERGKLPLTSNGSHDASTDLEQVEQWWTRWPAANVGIATGHGLLVVDLDGDDGIHAWADLTARYGVDETARTETGSGGMHILFRAGDEARNSAKLLGPGIDTRGKGGYIVAPPSVHPNGNPYRWLDLRQPAEAPAWLLERLAKPKPVAATLPVAPRAGFGATSFGRSAVEGLERTVRSAGEGQRNDMLNWAAYRAGQLDAAGEIQRSDAEALLLAAAQATGLAPREAEMTFKSGFEAGLSNPELSRQSEYAPGEPPPRISPPRISPPRAGWR